MGENTSFAPKDQPAVEATIKNMKIVNPSNERFKREISKSIKKSTS